MSNYYVNKVIINGISKIDLTQDTITPDVILSGYTGHDKSGAPIVGTKNILHAYVGNLIPNDSLGNEGDIYCIPTESIYKKIDGTWEKIQLPISNNEYDCLI